MLASNRAKLITGSKNADPGNDVMVCFPAFIKSASIFFSIGKGPFQECHFLIELTLIFPVHN